MCFPRRNLLLLAWSTAIHEPTKRLSMFDSQGSCISDQVPVGQTFVDWSWIRFCTVCIISQYYSYIFATGALIDSQCLYSMAAILYCRAQMWSKWTWKVRKRTVTVVKKINSDYIKIIMLHKMHTVHITLKTVFNILVLWMSTIFINKKIFIFFKTCANCTSSYFYILFYTHYGFFSRYLAFVNTFNIYDTDTSVWRLHPYSSIEFMVLPL